MDITLYKTKENLFFKKIRSKQELEGEADGFLIDSDEKEVRRIIDTLKSRNKKALIAVLGKDDEFNRRMIETAKINFLVSPEKFGKDSLKQRGSGLNHVVAKESKKKNIPIVINFSELKGDKKNVSERISRIMQNIVICRRAKCQIKIATFAVKPEDLRNENELKSFLFSLGASSEQVRDACGFKNNSA